MNEDENISFNSSLKLKLDNAMYLILLLVTFLTPIFFIPFGFISAQFGTSLLFAFGVIVSILLYIIGALYSGSISFPISSKYILGSTVLVPVVYVLAGIANGFSRMSFFGYTFDINTVGFILLGFAYLFLVSVTFNDRKKIFYSYFAFVISSVIIAAFLLIRIIFGADTLSFGIFNSITATTIGSWNNVGIFFGICTILSLLTYQMVSVSKLVKVILTISIVASLFFLSLVNFGTIWIILAISSFLIILYVVFSSYGDFSLSVLKKFLKIPLYPAIVLVISLAFVFVGDSLGGYMSTKLNISNVEIRPSLSATLDIARNTISDKPLFGSGPNTFINQWLTWKPDDIVSTIFWNLDFSNGIGLIPTFAVTTGLIGVLSWLLFIGYYLYIGFKSIFTKTEDEFTKYLITSSFFVSLYLWIMSFSYIPSTVVFIFTLFFTGLFFASVYVSGMIRVETKSFNLNAKVGFLTSLVMTALFIGNIALGYGLLQNSRSLWYFQKSSHALNTEKKADDSEIYMLKAISLVPYDIYYRALSEIELVKLSIVAGQDPKQVKTEDIQKKFGDVLSNAIKAGLYAKDADSANYLNWISLGRVYESVSSPNLKIKGAYDGAITAYTEAFRRNPKNPAILVTLSRLAATQGDLEKAKDYSLQAIQLKNNYLDAYFTLSQIEVANNNIKGAIDAVTASSIIDPTNPAIFFQLGLLKYNLQDWAGAITDLEKATSMTPDYANAKYFLGLSYEATKQHDKALEQFERLKVTNPDSQEVDSILKNLREGKPVFEDVKNTNPEKAKNLPVKERTEE